MTHPPLTPQEKLIRDLMRYKNRAITITIIMDKDGVPVSWLPIVDLGKPVMVQRDAAIAAKDVR